MEEDIRRAKNVVLIGMPGAGKSTAGVLLAERLGFSFLDTDIDIQVQEKESLQSLISRHGREGFAAVEERHVLSIACTRHVIAPGGSVVYRDPAMAHLKSLGCIVFLELPVDELQKRLGDLDARGVLRKPGQSLESLYEERQPHYRRWAQLTIPCAGITADAVAQRIVQELDQAGSHPAFPISAIPELK